MSEQPTKREKDLDRELRDHLELAAEAKTDLGTDANEARYAAQRARSPARRHRRWFAPFARARRRSGT